MSALVGGAPLLRSRRPCSCQIRFTTGLNKNNVRSLGSSPRHQISNMHARHRVGQLGRTCSGDMGRRADCHTVVPFTTTDGGTPESSHLSGCLSTVYADRRCAGALGDWMVTMSLLWIVPLPYSQYHDRLHSGSIGWLPNGPKANQGG